MEPNESKGALCIFLFTGIFLQYLQHDCAVLVLLFCCLFACLAGGSGGVAILLGNIQQCVLFDLAFFHIVVNV